MYKVLLADDEEVIIESISKLIDWEKYELELVGTARNGLEAYRKIMKYRPHIVITDIKMPVMNGLDLIKTVREELPDTIFVILSGYGEFDFANKAIQYGVKHYFLKPCDEEEIVPVLTQIVKDLKEKEKKENFLKKIETSLQKVMPLVKEQFLRDFVINGVCSRTDSKFFLNLFNISDDKFKLILLKPEQECNYIEKFALKSISEEIITSSGIKVYLSTIIGDNVLLLINSIDNDILIQALEEVKKNYLNYYEINLTIAISRGNSFDKIPHMYIETQECLQYSFYLGDGNIIAREDVLPYEGGNYNLNYDFNKIAMAVKTGNIEIVKNELEYFFAKIESVKMEPNLVKSYCTELFLCVVRQSNSEEMGLYMKKMTEIQEMNTLKQIYDFIKAISIEITQNNYNNNKRKYGMIVRKIIDYVEANIQNPDLSLRWIAKKILFMNEDYVGRLFKKETNENFSQYVTKLRIEKAKNLLESSANYKMYEICELVGFSDAQYFSQVFKKYTGFTPSEYKKMIEKKEAL